MSMMSRVMNYGKDTDQAYQEAVQNILNQFPYTRRKDGPVAVFDDFLYIGGYSDANNADGLRRVGINYVVNCAEFRKNHDNPYSSESGVKGYISFDAEDQEDYDMLQHHEEAFKFISDAKKSGGKVLVHCAMGINRSATICASFIMMDQQMDLLKTVQMIKEKKGLVLANRGFQMGLVKFARENGLLPELPGLST